MDFEDNISDFLLELDQIRTSRGLSYQAVADACGVSKSTICRTLSGQTEATAQLLQKIMSAVQYKPRREETELTDFSKDGYIAYLQSSLQIQKEESERRVRQLHAHYNMLLRRKDRVISMLAIAISLIVAAFIFWLIIDVTHPHIGWIQR